MEQVEHVNLKMNSEESNNKRKIKDSVLNNFGKLSKGGKAQVVKSSTNILKYLSETEDNELEYILNRLIRGLGATKTKIQASFFSAFVAILNATPNISIDDLFEIINKTLQTSSSNSKGENADIYGGRILSCGAIIHSKLFFNLTPEDQKKILVMLYESGKRRSYLQLQSTTFIADLIKDVTPAQFKDLILPIIKQDIVKPIEEHNLDSLYLLLITINKFSPSLKKVLPKEHMKIIKKENVKILCSLLINTISIKCVKHPIYEPLLDKITENCLLDFIEELDKCLEKSNHNRHLISVHILNTILDKLKDYSIMPELFPKQFMALTIHHLKHKYKQSEDLTKYLNIFFKNVVEKAKNLEHSTAVSVVKKLVFENGYFQFDQISKSNTVGDIVNSLNNEGIKEVIEIYKDIVILKSKPESSTEQWLNPDRIYAANIIVKLLKHPSIAEDIEFRQEQIKFLMNISLFKSRNYEISADLALALKKTFYSALDQKFTKLEQLCKVLSNIIMSLNAEMHKNVLISPLQDSAQVMWNKTVKIISKLEKSSKKTELNNAFYTMFLLMGLQLFEHSKLAEDCLNELFSCYERVKNVTKSGQAESEEEPQWIEVVIDLFLNLLSQNSHLFRNMIACVFPHLCKHLTTTTIHQILYVLDPENKANPLEADAEENVEAEEEMNEEESNDEISSEEESSASDEDEEDDTVNDKLRLAVQQALRNKNLDDDEESIDLDNMNEDEGMELDEALAAAFNAFKPNSGQKSKKQREEEQTLTHFRLRVLDLIKTYLNSTPSMILSLQILLPLLHLLEFTVRESHQVPLYTSIKKLIEKMSQLKKFSTIDGVNETTLIELLKSLLDKGTRNINVMRDMDEVLSHACIFILRCTHFYDAQESVTKKSKKKLKSAVLKFFTDELTNFFNTRDYLTPYVLFKNLVNLDSNLNCNLTPVLVDVAFNNEIKLFKRSQALQLLQVLYSNHRLINSLSQDERQLLITEFSNKTNNFLQNLHENKAANDKFLANVFICLSTIKKNSLFQDNSIDFTKLGELARDVRSSIKMSPNCVNQYKNLCKSFGINCVVQMNANLISLKSNGQTETDNEKENLPNDDNESGSDGDVSSKQNKKRKAKESKKEKQINRLTSLSKGFSDFVFEGMEENANVDLQSDTNEVTNKKRKKSKDEKVVVNKKKKNV